MSKGFRLPLILVIVFALVPAVAAGAESEVVSITGLTLSGEPRLGPADAPVTMVYWSDFQCPYCKRFEQNAFPKIVENYVDKGKVRVFYLNFQFLGPDSTTAGIVSECVWNQVKKSRPGAYWDWHDRVFANQDEENGGWGDEDDLVKLAKDIEGINVADLKGCLDNSTAKYKEEIDKDRDEGVKVGVRVTPSFVIFETGSKTGRKIVGLRPYSVFKNQIDQLL